MTSSIGQSIDILCNEQGLDRNMVIEAMKEAVKAAARKQFRVQDKTDSIQVEWNSEDGMIEISVEKTVVAEVENPSAELSLDEAREMAGDDVDLDDKLLIPLPQEEMGRIAAQTAKQILVQKVREAIRKKVFEEYIDRKGELINGTVKRFERGDMIIDLGNNLEAIVPRKEQSRGEMWNQGERIRVVIIDVLDEFQRGQQIKGSRASAELLKRLFEMEVPEIYDETVVIKSCVREPGDRAKIAVTSNEKDVDPVGACVGMKGSRVQAIIKELRGEKIDIIEWSDEPSVFAANALSPAKVSQVRITDIVNRQMEVIVGEDQLSLAIGKKGQNVRLAAGLVGWDIKIISEELLKAEVARQMGRMMASGEAVPITALDMVTSSQAEDLSEKGITDVEALAATSIDDLVDFLDVSFDEAQSILASATAIVAAKNAEENSDESGAGSAVEDVFDESDTDAVAAAEPSEEVSEADSGETGDADETPVQ
ncbi:MAG: transcription termination factor NusA [Chloracidobacterium sp.]|nr:transcription termination factor NusA [Chloracidobacterium sp.]MCC6824903.1 transcription termination factor NusA [Acidobacteriota bacterium]MCO5333577.1 transcription termination factor NusA [Pyrinomonadaceae bacterium]